LCTHNRRGGKKRDRSSQDLSEERMSRHTSTPDTQPATVLSFQNACNQFVSIVVGNIRGQPLAVCGSLRMELVDPPVK
jgi:hypothetical protein